MTNLLLALILLVIVAALGSGFALLLVVRSYIRRFERFINAPDEKTPSEFAQLTDAIGHTLGHAAAIEVKTTLMGISSGKSRLTEAIASEVIHETQPGLASIVDAIPRGMRRKNAGIFELLLEKFGPSLIGNFTGQGSGDGSGRSSPDNSNGSRPKFKL